MTETLPGTNRKNKTGLIIGLGVGLVLCGVVGVGLLGAGGVTIYVRQATAQAGATQTALTVQQQATAAAEAQTGTAVAEAEAATAAALAQSAAATARAEAATATTLADFAASTATAQFRANASTATARVRQTQATPTVFVPAPAASAWPLIILDTFDSNTGGWPIGPYSDDYGSGARSFSGGKYQWSATAQAGRLWRLNYGKEAASDLYLAVDVQVVSGSPKPRYGLVFRDDGANYYFFDAGGDGRFAFYVWYENQWTTLVGLTQSEAIAADGVNRLAVLAQGRQFTLFINGRQVAQAADGRLSKGQLGLAVNLTDKTDEAALKFDNFEFRAP